MEEKAQQIAAIKKRIADAEIEPAIEQLLAFLEKTPAYLNLHSDALQALAQFRKTKREEAQGIISYDQGRISYNQVVNQVLNILEDLDREEKAGAPTRRSWRPILIAALAGIALLIGGYFALGPTGGKNQGLSLEEICPEFSANSAFNILLLPYRYVRNPQNDLDDETPNLLRDRFLQFATQTGLGINPLTLPDKARIRRNPKQLPPDPAEIDKLGRGCPVQLVIWGLSETAADGSNLLTTNYKFLNLKEGGLEMTKLALNGTEIDTVKFISSIATTKTITENIEKVIQFLCSVMAHEAGQDSVAIAQLSSLNTDDDSLRFVRDVMLADTYLRTNQNEKAEATYNQLTEEHPQYWVAWYNRGLLNLDKGQNEEAAADLSNMLQLDSTNVDARVARAEAYLRLDQFVRAREDLEVAKKKQPDDPALQKRLDQIKSVIKQAQFVRDQALQKLTRNPADRTALREKTQADIRLGDAASAIETGKDWLQREPKNPDAWKALFQAYRDADRLEEARQLLNRAVQQGILSRETAAKWRNILQRDTSLLRLKTVNLTEKQ